MKNHKIYCREIFTRLPISMLFCLCFSFFSFARFSNFIATRSERDEFKSKPIPAHSWEKKEGGCEVEEKGEMRLKITKREFVTKKGSLFVAATVERRRKHDALHYWLLSSPFFPIISFLIAVESQLFEQINFPLSEKSFFHFIANAVSFCLIFV